MAGDEGGSWWNPIDNIIAKTVSVSGGDLTPGFNVFGRDPRYPETVTKVAQPQGVLSVQTDAPNTNPNDPYAVGGGGGAGAASDVAYYDSAISRLNALLGRADTTLAQGNQQLENSYQSELNKGNQAQSRTLQDYGVKRQDTERGRETAIGQVDNGARSLTNSLKRILGLAGSGVSSAAQIVAPQAVAKDASMKRAGVLDTYGQNFRNLDTAETRAKEDFASFLDELMNNKRSQQGALESGVENTRNDIRGQLSEAAMRRALAAGGGYSEARAASSPYDNAINNSASVLDSIFSKYNTNVTARPVEYQVPQLGAYSVDPTRARVAQQTGTPEELAPYLPYVKKATELF